MVTRNDLIEKAAKALFSDDSTNNLKASTAPEIWELCERFSRITLAVFEKSLAPTGDDRESLNYAIRCAIPNDLDYRPLWKLIQAIRDSVLAAGFRRSEVPEPSAESHDELEGILDRATLEEYMRVDPDETYESIVVKANALASTVRRLLAAPPEGEPFDRNGAAQCWAARTPIGPESAPVQAFEAGWDARGRVQAEPSNAEVQAFVSAINGEGFVLDRLAVRVGLRAAAAVRGTGGEQ